MKQLYDSDQYQEKGPFLLYILSGNLSFSTDAYVPKF